MVKRIARIVRVLSPGIYDFTIRRLTSPTLRTLRTLHRLPAERRMISRNAPRFAVNIGGRMGMGGLMSWTVRVLVYCDEHNLKPRLIFTNPVYAPVLGEDWLNCYFERRPELCDDLGEDPLLRKHYLRQSINIARRLQPSSRKLTLQRAHDLFTRYLSFRQELVDESNTFCSRNNIGAGTVGVHFRGTDKRLEATVVQWSDVADGVESQLKKNMSNIFVATDVPAFLQFMRDRFGSDTVLDLGCQEIFPNSPAHLTSGDALVKGSEAIRTILILSRCGVLVRTRSHLSAWSKILNPGLPTLVFGNMLHGNFDFPEGLIHTDINE